MSQIAKNSSDVRASETTGDWEVDALLNFLGVLNTKLATAEQNSHIGGSGQPSTYGTQPPVQPGGISASEAEGGPSHLLAIQLPKVIRAFRSAATSYFELAQTVVNRNSQYLADNGISPQFHLGRVRKKISDHVLLLSELVDMCMHSDLDEIDLVWAIVLAAGRRIQNSPKLLIPMPSTRFEFIHLNYCPDIGIIGFPPSIMANPPMGLPVVWHEVGAFWVAQLRHSKNGDLGTHAETIKCELQAQCRAHTDGPNCETLWDYYRGSFRKSLLATGQARIHLDDKNWLRLTDAKKIRAYFQLVHPGGGRVDIDSDSDWQMAWIGEFLEDLFGVKALGEVYFFTLASALLRASPALTLGDANHPFALLRLQVLIEYLRSDEETMLALEKNLPDVKAIDRGALTCLKFTMDNSSDPDLVKTAETITGYLGPLLVNGQSEGDWRIIDAEECAIADLVRRRIKRTWGLEASTDSGVAAEDKKIIEKVLAGLRPLPKEPQLKSDSDLQERIKSLPPKEQLEALQAYEFVDSDASEPGIGSTPTIPPGGSQPPVAPRNG